MSQLPESGAVVAFKATTTSDDLEEYRTMRSAFRNIPMTMIAVSAIFLAGCASTTSDNTRTALDTNACSENLYFYAYYKTGRYSTCEQQPCGDPLDADDVLVVKVNDGESLDAVVDARVGSNARYVDQWYLAGPFTTENHLNKAKRAFAARGCNLLIVGDTVWQRTLDPRDVSRQNRTQIRWGTY